MAARFDAFISYSRSASSRLAVELRNGIERFAKPWYRLRSSRVFLDDASMSANTGLWSTIEKGLTEADWFVLLCSPKAAESQYVTNEIAWWLEHKSADRILLVLDEGEILWDAGAQDFDWERATAVNRALSSAFAEEPRWVDLSWFEQEGSLGAADPRFPERVADLAAAIRFQERDELVGANVRERRRAFRLLRGGVIALSALLVASLVATVLAVVNGNAATEQARIAQARQLAAQAITLSATDLQAASLLAVEAVRLHDDAQTRAALFQLQTASPYLVRSLDAGAEVRATAVTPDGLIVTGGADGRVMTWDGGAGTVQFTLPADAAAVAVSDDGTVIAGVTANGGSALAVLMPEGGQDIDLALTGASEGYQVNYVALSPDGRYLAAGDRSSWTTLFERAGDQGFQVIGNVEAGGRVGFGDGEATLFSAFGDWTRVSLGDASVLDQGMHVLPQTFLSAVSGDGSRLAAALERGINYAVWLTEGSVSGGGVVDGDPADLVATSSIGGSLDLALDRTGDRLATMVEGGIYVSKVRSPSELPEPPLVLDGGGAINPETLSFQGDHLVNGSGEHALVWDLRSAGRITTEMMAEIPEGCTACGPQVVRVNDRGDRVVMSDVTGVSTVVADLGSGDWTLVDPDSSITGASWFDGDRLIVLDSGAGELQVRSGEGFTAVGLRIPVQLADGAAALAIVTDGRTRATVLDDAGSATTVDIVTGQVLASTDAFAAAVADNPVPSVFGVAPDQTTAFMGFYGASTAYVELATGKVLYEAQLDGAAYDAGSRLHVFAKGSEWTLDPATGALGVARVADVTDVPAPVLSPDGRFVVDGGQTGRIELIDLDSRGASVGRITVPVEDRKFAISAFTDDGTAVVTTIQAMASIDRPGTVRRTDLTLDGWIAAACGLAGRDLTHDEWRVFVGTTPPGDLRCDR